MERNIGLNEDILRHMTVRIEKFPEGPSPILRQSDDDRDDDRGDRGFGGDKFDRGDRGDKYDRFSRGGPRKPAATESAEGDA
jgi:small subunit ribosomal protein S6